MTFEDASRSEVETVVASVIEFMRGMVNAVIIAGEAQSIDELDGLLTRPDLVPTIMKYLES